MNYKKDISLLDRKRKAQEILDNYKEKKPIIIIVKDDKLSLDKNKYVCPNQLTIAQFMATIRKRIKLKETDALFVFTEKNTLAMPTTTIEELYSRERDEDGFLYLILATENTFG